MQVEQIVREEEKQIVYKLKKKMEALAARDRNTTEVGLFKIPKLTILRVMFGYMELDSINRFGATCWSVRRMIYSACGLKLISRIRLKNYSQKVSSEILSKVNTVIKNLQKTASSSDMSGKDQNNIKQGNSVEAKTGKKSLYSKLMGYSGSKRKTGRAEENPEVLKCQEELGKELESVKALKVYLHDQVELMKTTLTNNESTSKRNLNENRQLVQQNEELNFRLLEAKDNVKQLNTHYQQWAILFFGNWFC